MDRDDWNDLQDEMLIEGAKALLSKFKTEIAVLNEKVARLNSFLEKKTESSKK